MATQNRYYSNIANVTTLTNAGGISNSGTNLVVGSTTGFPVQFPFILRIEPATLTEEVVLVNSGSGTVGTPYVITRGFDGTTARAHSAGVVVKHGFAQIDFADPQVHLNATGPGGSPNPHSLPDFAWNNTLSIKIASSVLVSSAASVVFNSIPSTYSNLLIMYYARCDAATTATGLNIQLNGDTTADYNLEKMEANGNAAVSGVLTPSTATPQIGTIPGNTATANYFGAGQINIPAYTSASTFLPFYSMAVAFPNTGGGFVGVYGGMRAAAGALTAIKLFPSSSANFVVGSSFTLYGLI